MKYIFLTAIAVLSLSSCMEGEVYINVKSDLSGTMDTNLSVSGLTEYVSSDLKTMRYQFVPLGASDIKMITDFDDSLTLKNFKRTETGKDFSILYSVDFNNIKDLKKLSGYSDGIYVLSIDTSVPGVIRFTFHNPLPENTSDQTVKLISTLYGDKTLKITVKTAGFITETDTGALGEDPSTAFYSLKIGNLLAAKNLVWTIKYKNN